MTAPNIDELFAVTLRGDYDDDSAWMAVSELRRIGSREVFDIAAAWCNSPDTLTRTRGLDVLAQLGRTGDHPNNNFPEESYAVVSALVARETEIQPLASAICALGYLNNPLAIPLITNYCAHPSSDVRFDVAFALARFPNDPRSVDGLLLLMEDSDEHVRDWATFGLGTFSDCDSPEIRDALCRRLDDLNRDAREEAMAGMGKRHDERVLPSLMDALQKTSVSHCVLEAAARMLDMDTDPDDWEPENYVAALRERYGLGSSGPAFTRRAE